ncbi:MAG: type IX secretion system membrane protein PorP/SprF [Bacteroidales bacterium]|jgi:type IX secretion system PorP/SprF family membrane protein|nr:type IX secretion system membrane protein PorP/SprF [Bacteroidales bacterium]
MKRILLLIVIVSIISINFLFSQQLPLYSQYIMNDFYINPAIAGSKGYAPLVLSIHKQWAGIDHAPSTQVLSFHSMLPNKDMALGGILFHDSFGPEDRLGLQFTYAYHFYIDRHNKVSLGLAGVAMRYQMDERELHLHDYDDPAITYQLEKTIVPDANIGVYFYGQHYYAGITGANLFQSKLKINNNVKENKMVRHYYLFGGYKFEFSNQDWEIEPSVLLKFTELTRPQFDINAKVYYRKAFWFGVSLRPKDSFIANIGFQYKDYFLGFAYDFTFSDLSKYSFGSQEIILGWNINQSKGHKKNKSFF